jgi:hypothetical protein
MMMHARKLLVWLMLFVVAPSEVSSSSSSNNTTTTTTNSSLPLVVAGGCTILGSTSFGTYFPDLQSLPSTPPDLCCSKCQADQRCNSWTVVNFGSPACHLKQATFQELQAHKHDPGSKGWACSAGCNTKADPRFTSGYLIHPHSGPAPPNPPPPPPPPPPPTPTPPPAPPPAPAPPGPPGPPPTPAANYTVHPLPTAKCLNGAQASVSVWVNPTPSTVWLIQIGGPSPAVGFCVSGDACAQYGATNGTVPPPTPPKPPSPINGGNSIIGQNCTTNPDFCRANQVSISTCDFSFGLGDIVVKGSELSPPLKPPHDKTVMTFHGKKIMADSVQVLAKLGLSKATKVLLTGFAAAGQQVYLTADAWQAAIEGVAPGMKVFKALPVDGLRPNIRQTLFCTAGVMGTNCCPKPNTLACYNGTDSHRVPSWYQAALKGIAATAKITTPASLYPQDVLPTIKTDLFAVNQMVATWDAQCAYEGQPSGNILQVACSQRGNYFKAQYTCVQYPDLCNPAIIAAWWAPAQNEYISIYRAASTKNKNGGGGFFHQCYLGSYFEESYSTTPQAAGKVERGFTGVWNQISVNGKTMQQAISEWWALPMGSPGKW